MSEAPERIWLVAPCRDGYLARWETQEDHDMYEKDARDVCYIRADLARLPEDLVGRLSTAVEFDLQEQFGGDLVKRLIEDVLRWHEQREGGK